MAAYDLCDLCYTSSDETIKEVSLILIIEGDKKNREKVFRDLKMLAKRNRRPILINSQADKTTSTKTGPELDNIGFASAIGHDSDVILALFRDEEMLEDREMKVKIFKQREGVTGSVMLNWDFSTMDFSSIYSDVTKEQAHSGESNFVTI